VQKYMGTKRPGTRTEKITEDQTVVHEVSKTSCYVSRKVTYVHITQTIILAISDVALVQQKLLAVDHINIYGPVSHLCRIISMLDIEWHLRI